MPGLLRSVTPSLINNVSDAIDRHSQLSFHVKAAKEQETALGRPDTQQPCFGSFGYKATATFKMVISFLCRPEILHKPGTG